MLQIPVDINDTASIESALDQVLAKTNRRETIVAHLDEHGALRIAFGKRVGGPKGDFVEWTAAELDEADTVATHHNADAMYRGMRPVTSEMIFFRRAVAVKNLRPKIAAFARQVSADNRPAHGITLWTDDETQAGEEAMAALALADVNYIPEWIAYLRKCDLDHEVYQSDQINRVVVEHGWNEYTLALIAARSISCAGQHGLDDLGAYLNSHGLRQHLEDETQRSVFFHALVTDARATSFDVRKHIRHVLAKIDPEFLTQIDSDPRRSERYRCWRTALNEESDAAGSALASCVDILERFPEDVDLWHLRGVLAAAADRDVDALEALRRYASFDNATGTEHIVQWAERRANEYRREKDRGAADRLWQFAIELDDSAHNWYQRAQGLRDFDAYEEILALYDGAIARDPQLWDAYMWKANALRHLDRFDDARSTLVRLIELSKEGEYWYDLGHLLEQMDKYPEALEAYQRNADAGDRRARSGMARVFGLQGNKYEKAGRIDEAVAAYERAIAASPKYESLHNLGRIHLIRNEHQLALPLLQQAAELHEHSSVLNLLAIAQMGLKQPDAAMASFKRAIEIAPEELVLYGNIACLCAVAGDITGAVDWLGKALEKGFDNFEWIDKESDFDGIREEPAFMALLDRYRL